MQDGWKCENQCYIGENENKKAIPYFWSGDQDIGLKKNINYNNEDILLKCYIGRYEISIHAENKQSLNENYIEKIKIIADNNNYENLVNKIEISIKIKSRIKNNVNLNLMMDKYIIELEKS